MKPLFLTAALSLAPFVAQAQDAAQITPSMNVLTMVNVWTPEQGKQAEFVALLETALQSTLIHQPGFVSGNIHRSLDSDHVVMYAQWADQAALEAFIATMQSGGAPDMVAAFSAAKPDYHPYTVTATGVGLGG